MSKRKDVYRRIFVWVIAITFSVVWHGVWVVFLKPESTVHYVPIPSEAKVFYMPWSNDKQAETQVDIRRVWSPDLFALPSSIGFSQPLFSKDINIQPSLTVPSAARSSFPSRDDYVYNKKMVNMPSFSNVSLEVENYLSVSPALVEDPFYFAVDQTSIPSLIIDYLNGFSEADFLEKDLPPVEKVGAFPWEMIAYLQAGNSGIIEHVMIEQPAVDAKVNILLTRYFYRWRLGKKICPCEGRVLIRYTGDLNPNNRRVSQENT
ncbi:MAG: hypothetical protein GKR87_10365 [Kiritimatiellae bacterium]|nr:hypothetical protein [Kiritimatiellia bacterium]